MSDGAVPFEDNFSRQARQYALHRPVYPPALFAFVAAAASAHRRAWDCGAGNGQAAIAMAEHFEQVIATDASADQIAHARPHPRVDFRVAPAERSGIEPGSVDAVTVATALHWFDRDAFYREADRVLAPGGVIAVWSYFDNTVEGEEVDAVVRRFSKEIVGPYWSDRVRSMRGSYRDIPFPFDEIDVPPFTIEASWTLDDLVGYLSSWSATQAFLRANGYHPLDDVGDDLAAAWGAPDRERSVRWRLTMRAGRKRA